MLSRRSVRIKVMQLLFTINRDEELDFSELKERYWQSIDDTYNLFLCGIYTIVEVTKRSVDDERKRKSKHLPSDFDKLFEAKVYKNPLIQSIVSNREIQNAFLKCNFDKNQNKDYIFKIYQDFAKTEVYVDFLKKEYDKETTLELLLELFRICRRSELFNELMEDQYSNWIDDKSVVVGSIKKVIKGLPEVEEDFKRAFYPDSATIKDFGEQLLIWTHENDRELLKTIKPILKNWDSERVAVLDMIIIKMAICELLNFTTIPTKVTLNEYVELSKMYSTDKSKDFVNGILDTVLKEMEESGKIVKEGRGLLN